MSNVKTAYDSIDNPTAGQEIPYEQQGQPSTALTAFNANWAAKIARAKMTGTYKKCVDVEYGTHEIIGVLHQMVDLTQSEEVIDADTGDVTTVEQPGRKYYQLKLKLKDGRVMMAAGRASEKFWKEDLSGQLELPDTCGDFPAGISIMVKIVEEKLKGLTKEGTPKKWPVFMLV